MIPFFIILGILIGISVLLNREIAPRINEAKRIKKRDKLDTLSPISVDKPIVIPDRTTPVDGEKDFIGPPKPAECKLWVKEYEQWKQKNSHLLRK